MEPRLRPRAEMLIVSNETHHKQILLVCGGKGFYVFPGGGIKLGETPKQAAIREALEEAGVQVKSVKDPGLIHKRLGPTSAYRRDGIYYDGSQTHFFIGEFDCFDQTQIAGYENFNTEWLNPLDAIRVLCFNNWRYNSDFLQPLLVRALL